MADKLPRLGLLLSGRGSNYMAIGAAVERRALTAEIGVVISDREDAPGLAHARATGLDALFLSPRGFDREAYDRKLVAELEARAVDLVCLAGFMRIITPYFVRAFRHRILNIHPSLLPAFPGLAAQRQALEYGVKVSGCTVHLVDEGVDTGPIIAQAAVPVRPGDTVAALSARILEQEHRLYTEAIRIVLEGRWWVEGRRVVLEESEGAY